MAKGKPFIMLVTGTRDGMSQKLVDKEIAAVSLAHPDLIVITGGAPGIDTQCKLACNRLNVHCAVMTALWDTRHQSAGPQRNTAMGLLVGWERLDLVLAFHPNLKKSRGTADMVKQAQKQD